MENELRKDGKLKNPTITQENGNIEKSNGIYIASYIIHPSPL